MTTAINWEPFIIAIYAFLGFIGVCFLATLSDLFARGSRKPRQREQPVAWINGEKIYLN